MNKVYLLIGGNMGNRMANLDLALQLIATQVGALKKLSARYETAAWGNTNQPDFINQAILVQTPFAATVLMDLLLNIEKQMGRERSVPMGPRIIDIDIVYYNHDIIQANHLIVPHPKMSERRFVLLPLVEIAPDYIHPVLGKSNTLLLKECGDSLAVHKKTP